MPVRRKPLAGASLRTAIGVAMMAASALALVVPSASAADFPTKPIAIVVGSGPGSAPDVIARFLTEGMAARLGQPVIVENRAGAAGSIGAAAVARANPDGYSLLMMTAVHAITPSLVPDAQFDAVKSFSAVGMVAEVPLIFVVTPKLGVKTLKDFVALVKSRPGEINYSTPGVGTLQHLATLSLSKETGMDMVHAPFKSGSDAIKSVLANETQMFFAGMPPAIPQVKQGALTALGVSVPKRSAAAPDVPTMTEAGFPGYDVDNWHALVAPAGTPADVVGKIGEALKATLAKEDMTAKFMTVGAAPNWSSPADLGKFIADESKRWAKVIKDNNIKIAK